MQQAGYCVLVQFPFTNCLLRPTPLHKQPWCQISPRFPSLADTKKMARNLSISGLAELLALDQGNLCPVMLQDGVAFTEVTV